MTNYRDDATFWCIYGMLTTATGVLLVVGIFTEWGVVSSGITGLIIAGIYAIKSATSRRKKP